MYIKENKWDIITKKKTNINLPTGHQTNISTSHTTKLVDKLNTPYTKHNIE